MEANEQIAEVYTPNSMIKRVDLGNDFLLEFHQSHLKVVLYRQGIYIKAVELTDKVGKKIFLTELVELGAVKKRIAEAFTISRQTIHNYMEIKKYFGVEGLIHGYTVSDSKNRKTQRKLHANKRPQGSKARQVEELRRNSGGNELPAASDQGVQEDKETELPVEQQPFAEVHDWESSRYAGLFVYVIILISQWSWFSLISKWFGSGWKIFSVFLLMGGRNIRSIEQLKNVRNREAGIVLGLGKMPARNLVREWFYLAAEKGRSALLLNEYFGHQIRAGLVSTWLCFTDGHLLPYTGKVQVHSAYNTQRRMPVKGQTNLVSCDVSGRIVSFEIQEGKGNLRQRILDLAFNTDFQLKPGMVFDREGYDKHFFWSLSQAGCPFVCWDKYVSKEELDLIDERKFSETFVFNGKEYSVFEGEKTFTLKETEGEVPNTLTLRHIYIWNRKTNHRTCGLAWSGRQNLSMKECTEAILSRWGASENTFKHLQERHPFHYRPGFKFLESERQKIRNPKRKEQDILISKAQKTLNRLLNKLRKSKESATKKEGTPRANSVSQRIEKEVQSQEVELKKLKKEKKELPETVDVSGLENYESYQVLDNEGKNLFDFVTASVWNARKEMVDRLSLFCSEKSHEVVDLFYALTDCHGWVKSTETEVKVRLEPLQQPARRAAQKQLCGWLTALGAKTPAGKSLVIEVGDLPLPD